ncbi:MAG: hypothetical protein LBT97_12475 [Planctomycetota bacterium]|jgi:flavodoxin|nr:hypothetical protein [Planctomycetota bacterium]
MRTLFVFHSHEGNCRALAVAMAAAVRGEIQEVLRDPGAKPVPGGGAKYLVGGWEALLKKEPAISPLERDPAAYDLIVLGWPVWFGRVAPPIRTALRQIAWSGKSAALFNMHRGGPGGSLRETAAYVTGRGGRVVGAESFVDLRRGDAEKTKTGAVKWAADCVARVAAES